MIAENGFNRISIESIARSMSKSKSSFYHYFGDLELFIEDLLDHHEERSVLFAREISTCEHIRPDMVNIFVDYKTDLFFHKQLRINRANPTYKQCFEKVFHKYEVAILDNWAIFLGLEKQKAFAQAFLHLIAENFLLKITLDSYSHEWLDNYLEEIAVMLRQMNT